MADTSDYNPLTDPSWPGQTAPLPESVLGTTPPSGPSGRSVLSYARNPTPIPNGLTSAGLTNVGKNADVQNLNPTFRNRIAALQAAARTAGVESSIVSGYRSPELQSKLRANYEAKQAGQPLPFPQEGSGGIAAKPGQSFHNFGLAVDMYAPDSKGQSWLVANAPKYGLYPGANFGDPGHFQMAGGATPHDILTPGQSPKMPPSGQAQSVASAPGQESQPALTAPSASQLTGGTSAGSSPLTGLMTLAALQQAFPQHQFQPVDYNPAALVPKVSS